ncbi:hypothetical protein OIV83_002425 [Microbotryomycetes sp. JL201]|nr:hypothetical protein OIV83_002425 [Microbotryomycetes sp. JL201]
MGCPCKPGDGTPYVLRRIVWKVVAALYENIISYNIFKGLLNEWIPIIKRDFYVCLVYTVVAVCGFIGALLNVQLFLWMIVNAMEIVKVAGEIVELEEKVNEACNFVGKLFDADCDGFFDKVQTWTIAGCAAVLGIAALTLICSAEITSERDFSSQRGSRARRRSSTASARWPRKKNIIFTKNKSIHKERLTIILRSILTLWEKENGKDGEGGTTTEL